MRDLIYTVINTVLEATIRRRKCLW